MCGVVKLSISSLTAHTAGHGLDRDVGKVRPSVWVQRVPTSNRTLYITQLGSLDQLRTHARPQQTFGQPPSGSNWITAQKVHHKDTKARSFQVEAFCA